MLYPQSKQTIRWFMRYKDIINFTNAQVVFTDDTINNFNHIGIDTKKRIVYIYSPTKPSTKPTGIIPFENIKRIISL